TGCGGAAGLVAAAAPADRGCVALCSRASTHVQQRARTKPAVSACMNLFFRISKRDSPVASETNNKRRHKGRATSYSGGGNLRSRPLGHGHILLTGNSFQDVHPAAWPAHIEPIDD